MIDRKPKNTLVRVIVVPGFVLFLVLGLLLFLEYQSRGIGLAAEGSPGQADNLVINPGFEPPASTEWTCDGKDTPHDWRCYRWSGSEATLLWDRYFGFSESNSVLIVGRNDRGGAAWRTASRFSIKEDRQYSFTGLVRADYMLDKARARLALQFFDDQGDFIDTATSGEILHSTLSEPNNGWVKVKGCAMPPEGAVEARLDTQLLKGEGCVRFDNVMVSEISDNPPFLIFGIDAKPEPVSSTGTLTYVATVTNTGGSPASSIHLKSLLDIRTILAYSHTTSPSVYSRNGQTHIWSFTEGLPCRDSLSATLVVTVNAKTDSDNPLISNFEVNADDVDPASQGITTLIDPLIDFELSSCEPDVTTPGVAIGYAHTITNCSDRPISFTTSVPEEGCLGMATAMPEVTVSVSPFHTIPVTLIFTPSLGQPLPRDSISILKVEAPNGKAKTSECKTTVVSRGVYLPVILNNCRIGLCDPDFESDPFQPRCWERGWSGNMSAGLPMVVGSPLQICPGSHGPSNPASGQFAVLLGNPNLGSGVNYENIPVGHWGITQTFPIDPDSPPLTLTFRYRLFQYGKKKLQNGLVQDTFEVRINNSLVFTDGNNYCNFNCHDMDWPLPLEAVKDPTTRWAKVILPLSSYNTGSEITIQFEVWNRDNPDTTNRNYEYYNIWAYVDKIEILR